MPIDSAIPVIIRLGTPLLLFLLPFLILLPPVFNTGQGWAAADTEQRHDLTEIVTELTSGHPGKSGLYVLEKGEESLLARAWLTDHASRSVNVQYFIWSTDNIGILAAESLLRAAQRGVRVRVLVDDLMIDAPDEVMVALNTHPRIEVKIYNPKHSIGTTIMRRLFHIALQFKSVNQRMHDKTFTVDNLVSITGGRNMADEYFDYDHNYNFRDRDVLIIGAAVEDVCQNFETLWSSEHAAALQTLLQEKSISSEQQQSIYDNLHAYAENPNNFEPKVRRSLADMPGKFSALKRNLEWGEVRFLHDDPGKNETRGLSGGGKTTEALIELLTKAKESVLIQSPYLVMPKGGIEFFKKLVHRGVDVTISTNSLASTDNLQAFSGYLKQRERILKAGINVYEYKPSPEIQQNLIERFTDLKSETPTFAIHAKSMVVDHRHLFVGTYNLDPRSANLNTEVGVLISNARLAEKVEQSILQDISAENSWNCSKDNPDQYAPLVKRLKVWFWKLLPLEPIL